MVFEVNRSSYRYWKGRSKAIDPDRARLEEQVLSVHAASKGSAGARTIAQTMSNTGAPLSRYRATGLMKALNLVSCQQPKHSYKKATKEHVKIPNTLARGFDVSKPDQIWCGDITFIWTGQQ